MAAGSQVAVWERRHSEWLLIKSVPERDLALRVAIMPDGSRVAHLSRKEVALWDVARDDAPRTHACRSPRDIAFHPSGEWLAVASNTFSLVPISRTQDWFDFHLPGSQRSQPCPVHRLGFTRDGQWLWCSSGSGLEVFEWAQVPRDSGSTMPSPVWRFDVYAGPIFGVAEDPVESALLFAVGSRLHRLNLSTGEVLDLAQSPGDAHIYELVVSSDGRTLGASCRELRTESASPQQRPEGHYWDVWSLPCLLAQGRSQA